MVEIILYKKYNGPVKRFNWCPVVMVKVFESFNDWMLCAVRSETVKLKYCFSIQGREWGYLQAFGYLIRKVLIGLNIKTKNIFADGEKTQVCSETAYYIICKIFKKDFGLKGDLVGLRKLACLVRSLRDFKKM